jgi:hypothetical protein
MCSRLSHRSKSLSVVFLTPLSQLKSHTGSLKVPLLPGFKPASAGVDVVMFKCSSGALPELCHKCVMANTENVNA